MTHLNSLVAVRSQLARGVEAYLQAILTLNVPGWNFVGVRAQFAQVYEWPDVVTRAAADSRSGSPEGDEQDDDERGEFARSVDDRARQTWFANPRATEKDVARWRLCRRIFVVGRPGEGKTALTQMSAHELADLALATLRSRTTPLADLAIPLWVRVEDVVLAGSIRSAVEHTLKTIILPAALGRPPSGPETDPLVDVVARHLTTALSRPSATLFLDALDERKDRTPAGRDWREAFRDLSSLECRVVMTSRRYSKVGEDLEKLDFLAQTAGRDELDAFGVDCELAPLTPGQQRHFIGRWFPGEVDAAARVERLLQTHATFRDTATNALLLTIICTSGSELDESARRVHLYDRAVRDMLGGAHKPLTRAGETRSEAERLISIRLRVLADTAADLFEKWPRAFPDTVWPKTLKEACLRYLGSDASAFPQDLQSDLEVGGLLVSPTRGHLQFLHLTFYEYLAAVGLALDGSARVVAALTAHGEEDRWRQVALLVVGYLGLIAEDQDEASAVVTTLAARPRGRLAAWMGEALVDAGERDSRVGVSVEVVTRAARNVAVKALLATMRNEQVPAKTRADAGTSLGWLGDPRFAADAWWLPVAREDPLRGFVKIRKGAFTLGSDRAQDPRAYDDELPAHRVTLAKECYLARWPVTLAQFRAYAEDAGITPGDRRCLAGVSNHPVVSVSWREALGYGDWLTTKLRREPGPLRPLAEAFNGVFGVGRWRVTLPSEAEWEKAARSGDGRIYPWGNTLDANRANYRDTGLGDTSAVGCFPGGASPDGLEDLSGNVWEWTRSERRPYPYHAADGRESIDVSSNARRVVRGGSFRRGERRVRAAARAGASPGGRSGDLGFRVVVSPFSSDL